MVFLVALRVDRGQSHAIRGLMMMDSGATVEATAVEIPNTGEDRLQDNRAHTLLEEVHPLKCDEVHPREEMVLLHATSFTTVLHKEEPIPTDHEVPTVLPRQDNKAPHRAIDHDRQCTST
jgi:hypothetical protein